MAALSTPSDVGGKTWSSDGLVGLDLDEGASSENANKNVWNAWLPSTSLPLGLFVDGDSDDEEKGARARVAGVPGRSRARAREIRARFRRDERRNPPLALRRRTVRFSVSGEKSSLFGVGEPGHKTPRRLNSTERFELRMVRPDLDVRDSEWAKRVRGMAEKRAERGDEADDGAAPENPPPAYEDVVAGDAAAAETATAPRGDAADEARAAPREAVAKPAGRISWMVGLGRRLRRNVADSARTVARELREALDESLAEECGSDDDDDARQGDGFFATSHDLADI